MVPKLASLGKSYDPDGADDGDDDDDDDDDNDWGQNYYCAPPLPKVAADSLRVNCIPSA